jgi:long-chain acyl-CoA synthetase
VLAALRRRPADVPALSPDGTTWLSVGDLLERAAATADTLRGAGAVRVPGDDPVAAVVTLLAAQCLDVVPVVAATGPAAADHEILARAAALGGHRSRHGPLLVVVTSGSGGRPRAVLRTVTSWQLSLTAFDTLLGPAAGSGTVVWAPGTPASSLTLFALWHGLATGRPLIADGRWRGARAAARSGTGAVAVQCVPTVLGDILDAREDGALPALRRAVVAGAALTPALRARAARAGISVAEYYGAAELSFVAADPDGTGLRAFPGTEIAVRNGMIWARSDYLSLGYLVADRAPDGGAPHDDGNGPPQDDGNGPPHDDGNGPLHHDGNGWASVGDLGSLSEDGVLTVRGRGDGTATVGGATVTLAEVELALADVAGVAELVALAVPDDRLGERVIAVTRLGRDAPRVEVVTALRAAARERLAAPARPVRYLVRSDLPRTSAGKVARQTLLAQIAPPRPRTLST